VVVAGQVGFDVSISQLKTNVPIVEDEEKMKIKAGGSFSCNMALCVHHEGCCFTGFSWCCIGGFDG
jgi:hypothetical protein